MSTVLKVLIIVLCMNFCLAFAGIGLGGADVLSQYATVSDNKITPTDQFNMEGNYSVIPTTTNDAGGSVVPDGGSYSFIDTVKLIFKALVLILVSMFLPIYWGFVLGLPIWINFLLLIQTIVGIMSTILVIRGVGS